MRGTLHWLAAGRADRVLALTRAYHADVELDEIMARSNGRARRGRRFARLILAEAISFIAIIAIAVLLVAGTSTVGRGLDPLTMAPGVVVAAVGLVWMIRIFRANPEPDTSAWRYRDL